MAEVAQLGFGQQRELSIPIGRHWTGFVSSTISGNQCRSLQNLPNNFTLACFYSTHLFLQCFIRTYFCQKLVLCVFRRNQFDPTRYVYVLQHPQSLLLILLCHSVSSFFCWQNLWFGSNC